MIDVTSLTPTRASELQLSDLDPEVVDELSRCGSYGPDGFQPDALPVNTVHRLPLPDALHSWIDSLPKLDSTTGVVGIGMIAYGPTKDHDISAFINALHRLRNCELVDALLSPPVVIPLAQMGSYAQCALLFMFTTSSLQELKLQCGATERAEFTDGGLPPSLGMFVPDPEDPSKVIIGPRPIGIFRATDSDALHSLSA